MVIDADGLNAIADDPSILLSLKHTPVITPHPGEMSRLTGYSVREILDDTVNLARDFAVKYHTVVVLKDAKMCIRDRIGGGIRLAQKYGADVPYMTKVYKK